LPTARAFAWLARSWDITDQKNAEAEQARALERLTLAIEAGQFGVWEVDLATGERFWDRRTRELYGVDPFGPSPNYEEWLLTVHPDDRDLMRASTALLMEGACRSTNDFRLFWPNGELRHLRGLATLVRDTSGAPSRAVGIVADVTDAKIAEAELARLTERMTLALRAGQLGVWELISQPGERLSDETTMRHYGVDPANPIQAQEWIEQCIHPEDRDVLVQAISDTMNSPTPPRPNSAPSGRTERFIFCAISPPPCATAPARLSASSEICQDVTSVREMAQHLEEERQR